ncbi:MAG: thiamine diphosphokinase [Clostridia bacterium]|nr:thiamine diphosphokinase [Clostridia bacterium]
MKNFFFPKNEKICYIVGSYEFGEIHIEKGEGDVIISADGGLLLLEKNGILPDVIMGDFDSLGYIPKGENISVFPKEKDDSDSCIAVKYGFENGYNNFIIYGGVGGRIDHTFGNIQLLSMISERGGRGVLIGGKTALTVIKNSQLEIKGKGFVSVFSLSDKCEGVTLKNLKYTLENAELTNTFPLGLSNEFVNEEDFALIRVQNGTLLVVINEIT